MTFSLSHQKSCSWRTENKFPFPSNFHSLTAKTNIESIDDDDDAGEKKKELDSTFVCVSV